MAMGPTCSWSSRRGCGGGLGQSQELVLQRLIALWITAVAMQILVNELKAGFRSCAEGGLVGHRMGVASF